MTPPPFSKAGCARRTTSLFFLFSSSGRQQQQQQPPVPSSLCRVWQEQPPSIPPAAGELLPDSSSSSIINNKRPFFSTGCGNRRLLSSSSPHRTPFSSLLTDTDTDTDPAGEIDGYPAEYLTDYQEHAGLLAFYLATCATISRTATTATTTMPSTRKDASSAAAAASSTNNNKASPVAHKRKRKPGEARYYAVRAGRIPGVYTTWDECQSMINGYAGAQCECAPRVCDTKMTTNPFTARPPPPLFYTPPTPLPTKAEQKKGQPCT